MISRYTKPQRVAIGIGVIAAGSSLGLLLVEPLKTGHWDLPHFLLPPILAIAIGAAHLAYEAAHERRFGSAIGFLFASVMTTCLCLYASIGNQHEAAGSKAGVAEAHNQAITDKRNALAGEEGKRDVASRLLEGARQQLQADCVIGRKPKGHCDGVRTNIGVYEAALAGHQAVITRYEGELAKLGGEVSARPKAEALASILALAGYDRKAVIRVAEALEFPAFSVAFEITSIVAFAFAFTGNRRKPASLAGNSALDAPVTVPTVPEPQPPKPGNRRPVAVHAVATRAAAEADVIQLLARGQPLPSQEALRMRWGLKHRATVSKWMADFEARGLIVREAEGRCKAIRAATA